MSLPNDTTIVPLSRGLVAIIDGADADRVLAHKWSAGWTGTRWYARRSIGTNGDYHHLYLHRFILDAPPGVRVDHENGDGLDCRRHYRLLLFSSGLSLGTCVRPDFPSCDWTT